MNVGINRGNETLHLLCEVKGEFNETFNYFVLMKHLLFVLMKHLIINSSYQF